MPETIERLLSTRELADALGLTTRQVVRLWSKGDLPGYRLGERQIVRFRLSEVEEALRKRDEARAAVLEVDLPKVPASYTPGMFVPASDQEYDDDRTPFELIASSIHDMLRQQFALMERKGETSPSQLASATLDMLLIPGVNQTLPALYKPQAREQKGEQVVYFAALGSLVKIGISTDPEKRVASLAAELVATEPGGRKREGELHRRFDAARERMEWFRPTADLRCYVEALPTFAGWPA